MAMHKAVVGLEFQGFAEALLNERELIPRARVIAGEAARHLPGTAVVVYVFEATSSPPWKAKAIHGEVTLLDAGNDYSCGTLAQLQQEREPLLLSGRELRREQYPHLMMRHSVASLAYWPLFHEDQLLGAIEIISWERPLQEETLAVLSQMSGYAALGLASALAYESERNSNLSSLTRLTQLYDLERVFHSTLEMATLLPIITAKVRETLEVQAVNLWMVQEDDLLLMSQSGADPTMEIGAVCRSGQDIAGQVDETPVLITDPADSRLAERSRGLQRPFLASLMAVPIVVQGYQVGVLEAVNELPARTLDEDDLFFLSTIAETAGSALHNASLLESERKVEILETLVQVSQEITSTLNLDRVLQVLVNGPQQIMHYDRAAVALDARGRLQLRAVSGKTEVVSSDHEVRCLQEMIEYAGVSDGEVHVYVRDEMAVADREETRVRFAEYFRATGIRSWYSVPLSDDQGRLGLLMFESSNAEFLGGTQLEFIKVLATQATVAIRNASLYTEVPFIGVLEPLIQKKQRFLRMEKRRRIATLALAALSLLFLVAFPVPMRVVADSSVAPQTTSLVQAEVEGVVRRVYVREGDRVGAGTVLASLEDWEYRSALAAAQARYASAIAAMNRALAANDGTEAGVQRVQADYWDSEVARARERLDRTQLRSALQGVVATPHIEDLVGRKLAVGDTFAQVIDTSKAVIDAAVEETDLPLVHNGESATVKLDSFPASRLHGTVTVVSPASSAVNDKRVFYARISLPNPDGRLRTGMTGTSKIFTAWRPAGYVLFRDFAMWAWTRLWSWFGW